MLPTSAVSTAAAGGRATDGMLRFARDVSGSPEFADDFTLVHLVCREDRKRSTAPLFGMERMR
jgi:hypothetical protein